MHQIRIEGLFDHGRVEIYDGAIRTGQLDAAHRLEAITVIEADAVREAIKRRTVDLASIGLAVSPSQHRARIACRRDASDGMNGQWLSRQA